MNVDLLDLNTEVPFCVVRNKPGFTSAKLTKLECIRQLSKSFPGKQPLDHHPFDR